MKENYLEALTILKERFSKDSLIAVATAVENVPSVRTVDAYYEEGCFYSITYALSNKMKQIEENPKVAISGEWFTAHGVGKNLGHLLAEENQELHQKLKKCFSAWYDNGHINEENKNTCILCVELTEGVLFNNGKKYEIDFLNEDVK
jgi:Pyridoxamine 5''-phosphate oxidase.